MFVCVCVREREIERRLGVGETIGAYAAVLTDLNHSLRGVSSYLAHHSSSDDQEGDKSEQ